MHDRPVKSELTKCLFKIRHLRRPAKAFNLNRNKLSAFSCPKQPFCAEINVHIPLAPNKAQRIVCDRPSVFDECIANGIMIFVFGKHLKL